MSNKQMVNLDFLDREASLYKGAKTQITDNNKILRKTVEDHTKQEMDEVENAIKKLNTKIESIMKTDFVKEKQTIIETASKQMNKSMEMASNTYIKVRKIIREHPKLNDEQKKTFEKKLYDKIIDKFMTPEEKDLFNKLMSYGNIVMIGNNGMPMGMGNRMIGGL
jgi:hypothetical protein